MSKRLVASAIGKHTDEKGKETCYLDTYTTFFQFQRFLFLFNFAKGTTVSRVKKNVCFRDRAVFCPTELAYGNPTLGATPSLMADRFCVVSPVYIILTVIFEISSQFQILFVWRECPGHQVLIVLMVLSFRFSRTVLQSRKRQHPIHGQAL